MAGEFHSMNKISMAVIRGRGSNLTHVLQHVHTLGSSHFPTQLLCPDILTYHVELLLEFLIGIVDAELLKIVLIKYFKSVNIQHSNERGGVAIITRGSSGGEARVDGGHDPVEESAIQALGQTVSSSRRLYTHMYIQR